MKKMMQRFLACAMVVSLFAGIALTAHASGGSVIEPRANLYQSRVVSDDSTWDSREFSASSRNGSYIRFWFDNYTEGYCTVSLYRTDLSSGEMVVARMTVEGNQNEWDYYYSSTAQNGSYYIKIESTEQGGPIEGYVSAAQYVQIPA